MQPYQLRPGLHSKTVQSNYEQDKWGKKNKNQWPEQQMRIKIIQQCSCLDFLSLCLRDSIKVSNTDCLAAFFFFFFSL